MPRESNPSEIHFNDKYRVYRNHLTKQWHVLQGMRYIRVGITWAAALDLAVHLAEQDRKAHEKLLAMGRGELVRIGGV